MSTSLAHSPIKSVLNDTVADAFPLSRIASAAPTSPREAFVIRFGFGSKSRYLRRYLETTGIEKTAELGLAQVFHNRDMASRTAEMLGARVIKIFTDTDGRNPRLALLHNTEFSPLKASLRTCQMQEEKKVTHEEDEPLKDNYSPEADNQPNRQDQPNRKRSEVVPGGEVHVPNMYFAPSSLSEGRRLFVEFLDQFLRVETYGFQSGFGLCQDLILFKHPTIGSTLAIPADVMLLPCERARQIVETKIAENSAAFAVNDLPDPQSGYEETALSVGGGAVAAGAAI